MAISSDVITKLILQGKEVVNNKGLKRENSWCEVFVPLVIEPILEHLGVTTQTGKPLYEMRCYICVATRVVPR